jgi:hypothetical protein
MKNGLPRACSKMRRSILSASGLVLLRSSPRQSSNAGPWSNGLSLIDDKPSEILSVPASKARSRELTIRQERRCILLA